MSYPFNRSSLTTTHRLSTQYADVKSSPDGSTVLLTPDLVRQLKDESLVKGININCGDFNSGTIVASAWDTYVAATKTEDYDQIDLNVMYVSIPRPFMLSLKYKM
jgi:hypothetical protein